jgi:hypothetical protein
MMASLQQAIQSGMPPDQAIQYVKGMATQGVAPLADLYAMMNQFQRLKQAPVQMPQTPPTIKDQLSMMDQQRQMQERAMGQGLGGMNAGAMETPQFAGGGIVALAEGGTAEDGTSGIDFSKMSSEQLEMLSRGKDVEVAKAAFKEQLRRSGYRSPGELFSQYTEAVKAGIPTGPAIKFDMSGGAPAYMKDEQGRIRTPGMGKPVTSSITEGIVPMQRPEAVEPIVTQSAVPTGTGFVPNSPFASPQEAGAAFDRALTVAQRDVPQDTRPAVSVPPAASGARGGAGSRDRYAELRKDVEGRRFEEIEDQFSPEEEKRISKALTGLTAEKKDAVRMALAQAGFRMAAAASRAGRQRTTGLGALAEGAIGGMEQYNAAQKELRQTERQLSRDMADLRKYQDQVARGERTAKRDFEERKTRDILDLEVKSEQLRQFNAELGQRMKIAGMQYGGEDSAGAARIKTLDVNILNAQLEDARNELQNIRTIPPASVKLNSPEHAALIQTAQKRVNDLNRQLSGLLSGASGTAAMTGGTGPYSKMSDAEFKALLRKEAGI